MLFTSVCERTATASGSTLGSPLDGFHFPGLAQYRSTANVPRCICCGDVHFIIWTLTALHSAPDNLDTPHVQQLHYRGQNFLLIDRSITHLQNHSHKLLPINSSSSTQTEMEAQPGSDILLSPHS
jgi:hypothetical protein